MAKHIQAKPPKVSRITGRKIELTQHLMDSIGVKNGDYVLVKYHSGYIQVRKVDM